MHMRIDQAGHQKTAAHDGHALRRKRGAMVAGLHLGHPPRAYHQGRRLRLMALAVEPGFHADCKHVLHDAQAL